MHIEIQVALNFVISYLYNKLPRRRVNLFGDELEKALKQKFEGHWYPDKPFKGSAFRCLKTGDPIDQVFEIAAKESGVPIADILENLPHELSVWVDPGEVSYRIGEKGSVQILYSESHDTHEDSYIDKEVTKTFKPDSQCFRPIEAVAASLNNLNITPKVTHPASTSSSPMFKNNVMVSPTTPNNGFMNRSLAEPIKFTTATFAQTKFGSTKLKNNVKKTRMSPTEFSNYLKQKALHQQYHHSNNLFTSVHPGHLSVSPTRSMSPNSLSLNLQNDPYILTNMGMNIYPQLLPNVPNTRNVYETPTPSYADTVIFTPITANNSSTTATTPTSSLNTAPIKDNKLVDNYHSNQGSSYQHLLVAN